MTEDQRRGSQARQGGEGQQNSVVLYCNRRAEEDVEDVEDVEDGEDGEDAIVGNTIDDTTLFLCRS